MSYQIPRQLLGGLSVDKASQMGMPNNGASYLHSRGDAHKVTGRMGCVCCRVNPAEHAHHEPQKGMGGHKTLKLHGKTLRPSLHALCHRCHEAVHRGEIGIRWEWDSQEDMRRWWEGDMFAEGIAPGDVRLYDCGRWAYESR